MIESIRFEFAGGDDVQQLCDAGEDEFLEIMALVGMASKPLHVRRFQKALAEWVSNPAAFKVPLSSVGKFQRFFQSFFLISLNRNNCIKFIYQNTLQNQHELNLVPSP